MAVTLATLSVELVDDWCPSAPATVREAAAALVAATLKAEGGALGGYPSGVVAVDTRDGGQGVTSRDPMRASVMLRSGAAGLLASWRVPRARVIE